MRRFGRLEGVRLREVDFASRSPWKGDLAWGLISLVGSAS
jgi:hypothetical protein